MKRINSNGFTLTELLGVIVIMGLLVAIAKDELDYINDDDEQIPLYDSLFNKMVNVGNSYVDISAAIHYFVHRVMSRQFIDEEGKEIKNRFGYLKIY